jgi:CubicO group peptidase (beta-lactamase class C family)
MTAVLPDRVALERDIDRMLGEFGVPGAVVGVLAGDDTLVHASGTVRSPDGAPITPRTLFLIASITKVWTATLVLQLVDEHLLDLDEPVNHYLAPPLRLRDAASAEAITVRQLLSHSAGFYGNPTERPGAGDDAVEQTIAGYRDLRQMHRPGSLFSYSNAGYNVLGRVIECVRGCTWDDALKDHILRPLGLQHTFTLLEEAAVHPLAVGHEPTAPTSSVLEPVTVWADARGSGPCGGTLATTVADLLTFARAHLGDGAVPDGRRILSASAARLMREPQVALPFGSHWGLGWEISRLTGPRVIGHDGSTCGQQSILTIVAESRVAWCVLTNGDPHARLCREVNRRLLAELADTTLDEQLSPAGRGSDPDPEPMLGRYFYSDDVCIEVTKTADAPGLTMTVLTTGATAEEVPSFTSALAHVRDRTFLCTVPGTDQPQPIAFLTEDRGTGRPTHLSLGIRVAQRVQDEAS